MKSPTRTTALRSSNRNPEARCACTRECWSVICTWFPRYPSSSPRHPEVTVDLQLSNRVVDLVELNIDIDVRVGKMVDSSLVAKRLAESDRYLCASPSYLERHEAIEAPADLVRHNCLTYRLNQGPSVWRFARSGSALEEIPVSGNLQSDNGLALLAAIRAGVGLSIMPDWAVREDVATGRLRRVLPQYRISHIEFDNGVYAVYQKSRQPSPKLRVFLEFLVEAFRRQD